MSPERRETDRLTKLVINWPASKETIAGFTNAAFEFEYAQDRDFFLRTRGGGMVEGLLYDLGHNGRGMDDFPKKVSLSVPKPRQERVAWRREPNLITTAPFPQLYEQLTTEVEKYIVEHYRTKGGVFAPRRDAFQAEIDALKALAEQSADKLVTVTFEPFMGLHEIKRMEGEGYSY